MRTPALALLLLTGCSWSEGPEHVFAQVWTVGAGDLVDGDRVGVGTPIVACPRTSKRRVSAFPRYHPAVGTLSRDRGPMPVEQPRAMALGARPDPNPTVPLSTGCTSFVVDRAGPVDVTVFGTVEAEPGHDTIHLRAVESTTTLTWVNEGPALAGERLQYRVHAVSSSGPPPDVVSWSHPGGAIRLEGGAKTGFVQAETPSVSVGDLPPRPVQARADGVALGPLTPVERGYQVEIQPHVGGRSISELGGDHLVTVSTPTVCTTQRTPRAASEEIDVRHHGTVFVRPTENAEEGPCRLTIDSTILNERYRLDAEIALPG